VLNDAGLVLSITPTFSSSHSPKPGELSETRNDT
jgi:hypothetical protein